MGNLNGFFFRWNKFKIDPTIWNYGLWLTNFIKKIRIEE